MKFITKLALVSVLALSAAPALAASAVANTDPEALTLIERNAYLFTPDAREIVRGSQQQVRAHSAVDAFAAAPAVTIDNDRHSPLLAN